jgi:hypothetical protein
MEAIFMFLPSAKPTHNKAIAEMIKLDRQAGITTRTRDGLD